ncbi:alpha/beta-hydrolase [Stemphylium lycopersici]|uniref:Alpha/beta-hydrolase n=1 Tax=Stemphylium lycopersici TaxID=183478 RepID=A0A364NB99_STELY|nr:alpha/beta-hydrolase [Stemphylium lycopersici]RAR14589.1 alpha/beta-hydrolase [Stemphylium lycopersici]
MASLTSSRPTFTFNHAQLGPMTGVIAPDNVVQFRAIKYATIPARFKASILAETLSGKEDFTQHGYACPQTFNKDVGGGGPFPGEASPPPSDELNCLILQVNVPLLCLQSNPPPSKLPVLVYIHGGGFIFGKVDEQHSTALMVEQSILDNQPIIGASLQYRLGALGYLHTPESGNSNRALNDQRNAFLWIQKFIEGFGGDRGRVTAMGESAGSMSISAHMLSPVPASGPLFQRAIMMSGILGPATAPASLEEAGKSYEVFLKTVGIEERGQAGLQRLREMDLQMLVNASTEWRVSGKSWPPVQDEQFFGKSAGSVTWDKVPELTAKCDWVNEIILGNTGFEGLNFRGKVASATAGSFLDGITKQLGSESAELVSQAYGINPGDDQNLYETAAMRWMAPTHLLAQYLSTHTSKRSYRYIFDIRNPFPSSPWYQQPHHWVDVYYVFKTFQFRFPRQKLKDISTQHARLWVDFTNGKTPWTEYKYTGKGDEVIIVADERDGWVERSVREQENISENSWRRCEALVESWKDSMVAQSASMADEESSKALASPFAILTPRLILIPTTLAISNTSYLALYASLHADAAFCEMGFGPSFPVKAWTQDETRQIIVTRDIARSWEKRNIGDFAVGLRPTAHIDHIVSRPLVENELRARIVEDATPTTIAQACSATEWVGYAGVREATTTSMPLRTPCDPPLPAWQEMIELRYGAAPAYWGKGMAREAAEAVMLWAKCERGVKRFIAETEKANERSARVLEKMGFVRSETDYWKDEEEVEWEKKVTL